MRPYFDVKLNKNQKRSVLAMFEGRSKKYPQTKDARKIAETLDLPRYHVMAFLEDEGLKDYSYGSYC